MPTLGLCVIAIDAAATLRACLESVSGLVDAMVVVDTGSLDATREIARTSGAAVVQFPWMNDFAAARNAALAAIETDWVLVLDADEELDAAAHAWIRTELKAPRADGYVTSVRNYLQPWDQPLGDQVAIPAGEHHPRAANATAYRHSEVCRLYRRDPDIYYVGHVHEQVEYRLMELGRSIGKAGFYIHHFGWYLIDEKGRRRKEQMYRELLAEKVRQRPDDPLALMQHGDALCAQPGRVEEGLACLMKAASLKGDYPLLWTRIASALFLLGQMDAVLVALGQVPAKAGYAGECAFLRGEALGALKRWSEARAAYREALEYYPDSIRIQAKLAGAEIEAGDRAQGTWRMRATVAAAEAQAAEHRHAHLYFGAAELHAQLKQWLDALRMTELGLALDPEMLALHDLRLKAAVAEGELGEAAFAAERIAELRPEPSSFLRHAAILNQYGKQEEAAEVIRRALERLPLSNVLQAAGRELAIEMSAVGSPA